MAANYHDTIIDTIELPEYDAYRIPVLFEDNHLLCVVKPPGLLAQEDITGDPDLLTICKLYLKRKYDKPGDAWLGLLHRVDRPVGGVMLFAKTSKAASRLSEQIRKREWKKRYQALCHGKFEQDAARLVDFLSRDKTGGRYTVASADSSGHAPKGFRRAELAYSVIGYDSAIDISAVNIDLLTGRPHQIRLQLSRHGHPLLGDRLYGDRDADLAVNYRGDIRLWARELVIFHPISKESYRFVAEADFIKAFI